MTHGSKEKTSSRDNNFNLLRALAALAVLVSHSFALVAGTGDAEPLRHSLGTTPGALAVQTFFVISGYLVTGSLLHRRSALRFLEARALRIVPGLLVMLILTGLVLGPAVTSLGIGEYLAHPTTHRYLGKNAVLLFGASYSLPGVFAQNPMPEVVNGSLWSLPLEVGMYVCLALLGLLLGTAKPRRETLFRRCVSGVALALGGVAILRHFRGGPLSDPSWLGYLFFVGSVFWLWKDKIAFRKSIALAVLGALCASTLSRHSFFLVSAVAVPYLVLYLAHAPGGVLRRYNRLGDYSYGLYVYAFPIQQALLALAPDLSVAELVLSSFAGTLVLAALSWHFVEEPALRLKRIWTRKTPALEPSSEHTYSK